MGVKDVHRRLILAPTPRERALRQAQGLARRLAAGPRLDRLGHGRGTGTGSTHHRAMGVRLRGGRACSLDIRADRWFPLALGETQQAELKAAVQELPEQAGIELANWSLRQAQEEGGAAVCLGTVWHRVEPQQQLSELYAPLGICPEASKKRLLKADEGKREAFVAEYAVLSNEARRSGAKIFFADEAHFRADAELRGKWVQRGDAALVESSSPRYGEKAIYHSAVCLETGEVEWMELEGNSNSGTSAAFLRQLRERHPGPLNVIWDNAPAHRGKAVREYLGDAWLGAEAGELARLQFGHQR